MALELEAEENGLAPEEENGLTPEEENGLTPEEENGLAPEEAPEEVPEEENGLAPEEFPAEENGLAPEEPAGDYDEVDKDLFPEEPEAEEPVAGEEEPPVAAEEPVVAAEEPAEEPVFNSEGPAEEPTEFENAEFAAPEDPEIDYAKLHPVYTRCSAKVDLLGFSLAIQKTCGDIHELSEVAWPCRSAMSDYSKKFGCCWETVMSGYEALYPDAAQSWRLWQGTLSGKAGVTFESDSCGESMGEKSYTDLTKQVGDLQDVVQSQSNEITTLESYLGYGGNPYYYYYYKSHPAGLKSSKSKLAAYAPATAYLPRGRRAAARRAPQARPLRAAAHPYKASASRGGSALRRAGVNV